MNKIVFLVFLLSFSLIITAYPYSDDISDSIKAHAKLLKLQNELNKDNLVLILESFLTHGIINNDINIKTPIYDISKKNYVHISDKIPVYRKSGNIFLELTKPDGSIDLLQTPLLETGGYSTVLLINSQSQTGKYQIVSKFEGAITSVQYFYLVDKEKMMEKIPFWVKVIFEWWTDNKISNEEFIYCIQFLIDKRILFIYTTHMQEEEFQVIVTGPQMVRRDTTQTIVTHVSYGDIPVEGARVTLTIEDYGENIIREFEGFTNRNGDFIFSWEIPKTFDDLETLLAYISVTDNVSSQTKLFKFQVYCHPGEFNCKIEGN